MPPASWYCGHCGNGPLSSLNELYCLVCFRRRYQFSTLEAIDLGTWPSYYTVPDAQSEDPWATSLSSGDTESVSTPAASDGEAPSLKKSSVNLSPEDFELSQHSRFVIDTAGVNLGLVPNNCISSTVHSSWERKSASPDDPVIQTDPDVTLSKNNVLRIGSTDKRSRLNDYLSVNPGDPWNQEWVVYAARTPLPGESSYSLETGEPATTSRRRPYNQRRRAEVAFTRNHGGACEQCRQKHRACLHRIQEFVAGGNGTASEQVMEGGVARRADDNLPFDVADGIGSSTEYGGTTNPESSTEDMRFTPIPRRELPQRPPDRRIMRAEPSWQLALGPSQRSQASLPSLALDEEPAARHGRPRGRVRVHSLGSRPARRSARHGQGSKFMSGSSGSSRQSNNAVICETGQDPTASTAIEETYGLGGTQHGTEELSYIHDAAGLRSSPPLSYVEQQSPSSEQMLSTRTQTFDTAPDQLTSIPHPFLPCSGGVYGNLDGIQARDANVLDPPGSSPRNHLDPIPTRDLDESSIPFFRPSETQFCPSQQGDFGQVDFNEQAVGSTSFMSDLSVPQTPLNAELMFVPEEQRAVPNPSYDFLSWQIADGSLVYAHFPEQIYDTASLDELLVAPEQTGNQHATYLPLAMDASQRPAGLYEQNDIDLPADLAWGHFYYGGVDRSVDPPSEGYANYLGSPIFTDVQESTTGSNSNPIPTPPSDETG